jgi:hypothetical protein
MKEAADRNLAKLLYQISSGQHIARRGRCCTRPLLTRYLSDTHKKLIKMIDDEISKFEGFKVYCIIDELNEVMSTHAVRGLISFV